MQIVDETITDIFEIEVPKDKSFENLTKSDEINTPPDDSFENVNLHHEAEIGYSMHQKQSRRCCISNCKSVNKKLHTFPAIIKSGSIDSVAVERYN